MSSYAFIPLSYTFILVANPNPNPFHWYSLHYNRNAMFLVLVARFMHNGLTLACYTDPKPDTDVKLVKKKYSHDAI